MGRPEAVTRIAFRPSATAPYGHAFAATLGHVRIDLSTTPRGAGELSTTFATNVGGDNVTVFDGPLSLSSAWVGPEGGPKEFDIVIDLATPFTYDPSRGNLLMDVRNFGGETTAAFNGVVAVTDGLARVWTPDVNATFAVFGDDAGLVTKFTTVPEPSALWGAAALAVIGLRRRGRGATARSARCARTAGRSRRT